MTDLCPEPDLLSAYVDREANPSEERRVDLHLADCGACRARVRSLARLKTAVRNQPLPPLPAGLREELLRRADAGVPSRAGWLLRDWGWAAPRPRLALGAAIAAAALALSLGAWWLHAPQGASVPIDLLLAAHNEYALTMPLAPSETIFSDLPVEVSDAGGEEAGDVY